MAIQSGDVKLVASAVMDDVPEGGGAPTPTVIADNASNAIFKDISESDRARGRVNLAKVFASVQTGDVDTYLGANMIVAKPPSDANVSITMFTTNEVYDTRQGAQARLEAYLNKGSEWGGFLFENHIAGQRVIQLFQRPSAEVPTAGKTLVLVLNEGLANERVQYVRATRVSSVIRTFTYDGDKDYQAAIVTVELSDALRYDFAGTSANRQFTRSTTAAVVRDTTVADAGSYVGVTPLAQAAAIGDATIRVSSIYSQLVPSAQTETPISAANPFGAMSIPVSGPGLVTYEAGGAWSPGFAMSLPGGLTPGTFSAVPYLSGGVRITDKAGLLYAGTAQVGTIDYENGIATLTSGIYTAGAQVTYRPAAFVLGQPQSVAFAVTAENRAQSYSGFIQPIAAPGTLSLSYQVQRRWYTIRDDGSGKLSGYDASYGAGTYSSSTGNLLVTLGALPDVGSALVMQWGVQTQEVTWPKANISLNQTVALNLPAGKMMTPGSLVLTWNDGAAKTASTTAGGTISGAASGTVNLYDKTVTFSPTTLPPVGTQITLDFDHGAQTTQTLNPARSGTNPVTFTLGAGSLTPGSVSLSWTASPDMSGIPTYIQMLINNGTAGSDFAPRTLTARDNGSGRILLDQSGVDIGSINYSTGVVTITPDSGNVQLVIPRITLSPPVLASAS